MELGYVNMWLGECGLLFGDRLLSWQFSCDWGYCCAMARRLELGAEKALSLVRSKWFIGILHALMGGSQRFGELQRGLAGVSKKVLLDTLRRMERDGFVGRREIADFERSQEYFLTELGQSIVAPLQTLCHWADDHFDEVLKNRQRG